MIRQAISCDICGRDKQQTNHWFVGYEHGAELRVSSLSSQARISAKVKHLCGQTCLHKLLDEFMTRTFAARAAVAVAMQSEEMESSARLIAPAEAAESAESAKPEELAFAAPAVSEPPCARPAQTEPELAPSTDLIAPIDCDPREAPQSVAPVSASPKPDPSPKSDDEAEQAVRVIMPILELHDEPLPSSRSICNPRSWRTDAWKREQEREKRARTNSRRRPPA